MKHIAPTALVLALLLLAPDPSSGCGPGDADRTSGACLPGGRVFDFGTRDRPDSSDICPDQVIHGMAGVGGVAQFFMSLEHYDEEFYRPVWQGALQWIENDAEPGDPGYKWEAVHCDGIKAPGRVSTMWNAELFCRGYLYAEDSAYVAVADSAVAWVDSEKIDADTLYSGSNGYIWIEKAFEAPAPEYYSLGALHGMCAIGRHALEIYRISGSMMARDLAMGVGRTVRDAAVVDTEKGGHFWYAFGGMYGSPYTHTGFCLGAAGIIEFLIEMDYTLSGMGEVDYRAVAEGGLKWLMAVADSADGGLRWEKDLDHTGSGYWPIAGFGATGVGRAFLRAPHQFGEDVYLDTAIGAGDWIVAQADQSGDGRLAWWREVPADSSSDVKTSWCRGALGALHFLQRLGVETSNYFYTSTARKAVRWLESMQEETADGQFVFPVRVGDAEQVSGRAYGVSGMVNPVYDPADGVIDTEPFKSVAIDAAEFLIQRRIITEEGHYWNHSMPFDTTTVSVPDVPPPRRPDKFDARIYPTPSSGPFAILLRFDHPVSDQRLRLDVYDVGGRRVLSRAADGRIDGTEARIMWDGRDEKKRLVPRGVYFLRVLAGTQTRELKVAVIR